MDKSDAYFTIDQLIKQTNDDEILAAWHVLTTVETPSPPTPLGHAHIEAANLAHQIHKTGSANGWKTPPHHSEAMERLIHSLTNLLNRLLNLYAMENGND